MKDVELPYKVKPLSKLIRGWHLMVADDKKQAEVSFMTMDGVWHSLYFITDKVAVDSLIVTGKNGKQG